ncbi:mutator type transposase [Tanacetum coccineum]
MSTSSLMAEKTVHNVAYTDLQHKAKCRVLILARTNLSQHNFTTCSRLHNFMTSSQLQDFFTTLLISQLSSTTCGDKNAVSGDENVRCGDENVGSGDENAASGDDNVVNADENDASGDENDNVEGVEDIVDDEHIIDQIDVNGRV